MGQLCCKSKKSDWREAKKDESNGDGTLHVMFNRFDKDRKGYISKDDLQKMMRDDKTHFQGKDANHISKFVVVIGLKEKDRYFQERLSSAACWCPSRALMKPFFFMRLPVFLIKISVEKYGTDDKMTISAFELWWKSTYTTYSDDGLSKMVEEAENAPSPLDTIPELPDVPLNSNIAVSRS